MTDYYVHIPDADDLGGVATPAGMAVIVAHATLEHERAGLPPPTYKLEAADGATRRPLTFSEQSDFDTALRGRLRELS